MSEALILGAGLGGLLCGSLLARDSFAVTVLEQGRQAGGALQCFVREGIRFDTGFHSVGGLGPGEPLERVFGPLGLLSLPWIRMEEDEVVLQGRSYPLSACPEGAFLRLNGGGELEMEHVIGPYLQSSWRLRGGGKVLADALIADIRSRGGQVLCGKKATVLSGGCVCCADGSSYSAPVIVSSLHPLRTLDLVQDRVRPSYRRTLASYTDGPGIFSVQIKLKPGAIPFVNHAIFLEKTVMIHFGEPDADGFSRSLDLLRFAPAVIPDREALARAGITTLFIYGDTLSGTITEDGTAELNYSYINKSSYSPSSRLSALENSEQGLLFAIDLVQSTVTERQEAEIFSLIRDEEDKGRIVVRGVKDAVQTVRDRLEQEQQKLEEFLSEQAERSARIEELEETIREIYSHWDD